jgi:chromosome segregation ATPase
MLYARLIVCAYNASYALIFKHGVTVRVPLQFERLLKHFSVDAWNPCILVDTTIIEQLVRGSDAERYKYFMEATDLHYKRLSLEDDAIDLQGLAEVAAKERTAMAHLQRTVQQQRDLYALYTAVERTRQEGTRLSAQLAWAELAQAEADVTAAEQQLAVAQAALQRAEAARTEHVQSVTAKTQERDELYAARVQCERAEQQARTALAAADDHLDLVRAPVVAENKPLRVQLKALIQSATEAAEAAQHGAMPQLQVIEADIASLQRVVTDSAAQRQARQQQLSAAQAQRTAAAQQLKDAVKSAAAAVTAHHRGRSTASRLQHSSALFTHVVVHRTDNVQRQQATVTALQAAAAGKLAAASEQQVLHCEGTDTQWDGERVAVAAQDSVQQRQHL